MNLIGTENDKMQPDLNAIKTDVVGRDRFELLQTLNRFSEFFITGMPVGHVPVEVDSSDDQEEEPFHGW